MTATLHLWCGLLPTRDERAASRWLRKLRRGVGKPREFEVYVVLLELRLPEATADTRAAAEPILERLKSRLARHRIRAARRVRPKRFKPQIRALEQAVSRLRSRLPKAPKAFEGALAVERIMAAAARSAIAKAETRAEDAFLHQARIAVKKWRYTIESIEDAAPGVSSRSMGDLRLMQEVLGRIHDRALLRDLLRAKSRKGQTEGVAHALQPLIDVLDEESRGAVQEFRLLAVAGALSDVGARGAAVALRQDAQESSAATSNVAGAEVVTKVVSDEVTQEDDRSRVARWDQMTEWLRKTGRNG